MEYTGNLHKMHVALESPVTYQLTLGGQVLDLNAQLGKQLRIEFLDEISCIHCGRATKKSFSQGYCYPCFTSLAQCDLCIVSPEKCHFHLGTCREPEWAQDHCMKPHVIYLSNTSGVKVGITRESQVPTRWIDQGAVEALPILRVSSRLNAGLIETAFKQHLNDKTNWRKMLKNELEEVDLSTVFATAWAQVEPQLDESLRQDVELLEGQMSAVEINYPALAYPEKISSFNLDKQSSVSGVLEAIKGQYLLLDSGVINIRKFSGYLVRITTEGL